jgi:hypothetical protein
MMDMVKNTYLANLHGFSTDIERLLMDSEFWYQQHTLDSDNHHLSRHMIDVVWNYIRGDATRMETCIELCEVAYEHKHCKGIFCLEQAYPGCNSAHAC